MKDAPCIQIFLQTNPGTPLEFCLASGAKNLALPSISVEECGQGKEGAGKGAKTREDPDLEVTATREPQRAASRPYIPLR